MWARARPKQVDELIDDKGGTSSPLKAKSLSSRSKPSSKSRRKNTVVDDKQSTHNQLALMDVDNLQLVVGQVRGFSWAGAVACTRKCHWLPSMDAHASHARKCHWLSSMDAHASHALETHARTPHAGGSEV